MNFIYMTTADQCRAILESITAQTIALDTDFGREIELATKVKKLLWEM